MSCVDHLPPQSFVETGAASDHGGQWLSFEVVKFVPSEYRSCLGNRNR